MNVQGLWLAAHGSQQRLTKRGSDHCRLLDEAQGIGWEAIETRQEQPLNVRRDVEGRDVGGADPAVPISLQCAGLDQSAHDLLRVERVAVRAGDYQLPHAIRDAVRVAPKEGIQERSARVVGERRQADGGIRRAATCEPTSVEVEAVWEREQA